MAAALRSGHQIKELIDKKCFRVFASRSDVCPHCPLKKTFQTGSHQYAEIDQLMPEGDFTVSSYPVNQPDPLVVHHYRDVTEERRLQHKLIQSEKMAAIGMLAGGVAHEINNPLAGILAFTQILKSELPEGETRTDLGEIEAAAKRCKKIVEDLLAFSRPHGQSDLQTMSLPETIDQILPLSKLNLRHRNVTLETLYEVGLPAVRGSVARLQQVFLNLINNAAQAMASGGQVTLRVFSDRAQGQIVAEVLDHGSGIKKEFVDRIFDPFFSTKEHGEGTGLGLSICYSIVQEHGGKIEVESEEGRGSIFRVILPVNPPEAEEISDAVYSRH